MPQSTTKICIFDNVLDPALVEKAYEILQAQRIPASTVYLPIKYLTHEKRLLTELSSCVAEPVGALLAKYCTALHQRAAGVFCQQLDGLEIWTNYSIEGSPNVWLHIDNDETHRKETGELRHPLFGSVLHLGPITGMRGGETFFCLSDEPKLDNITFRTLPWSLVASVVASSGMTVPFRAGRTILFDGRLAHCVAPFTLGDEQKPRLTLLVNGWLNSIKLA
jgi:hypothetical protein